MPPLRVVIADDHVAFRQALAGCLGRADLHVVAQAKDGGEAVLLAQEHQPDVMILDLAMPVLDGIEVASLLRHSHPKMKFILLTGHSDQPFSEEARRAGLDGFVPKSRAVDELLEVIHDVVQGVVRVP